MHIGGKNYTLASSSPEYWSKWEFEGIINNIFQCSVGKIEFTQKIDLSFHELIQNIYFFLISNKDLQCAYPGVHRFLVKSHLYITECLSKKDYKRKSIPTQPVYFQCLVEFFKIPKVKKCFWTWVDDTLQRTDLGRKMPFGRMSWDSSLNPTICMPPCT